MVPGPVLPQPPVRPLPWWFWDVGLCDLGLVTHPFCFRLLLNGDDDVTALCVGGCRSQHAGGGGVFT